MNDILIVRDNLPAVRAQMREFGLDFERRVVRSATNAAAQVIKRLAKQNAPVLKETRRGRVAGALRAAIYVGRDRRVSRGTERQFVSVKAKGSNKLAPFYWRFLESGWIPRGPGKKFTGGERTRSLKRSRALAGGARRIAYPFIAPSFSSGQGAAINAFYARIAARIEKENAKRTPK
jgi:HK97 gp10 family phage protein